MPGGTTEYFEVNENDVITVLSGEINISFSSIIMFIKVGKVGGIGSWGRGLLEASYFVICTSPKDF